MQTTQVRASKGYLRRGRYSEGVIHHPLDLAEIQRQAEEWKSFIVEEGKILGMPGLGIAGWRSWRQTNRKWGVLCDEGSILAFSNCF